MVHINSPTYITTKFPVFRGIQFIKQIVEGDILFYQTSNTLQEVCVYHIVKTMTGIKFRTICIGFVSVYARYQ